MKKELPQSRKTIGRIIFPLLLLLLAISVNGQIIETFETETDNTTTFSEGGFTFNVTGDLQVQIGGPFGAGGSNGWLDSQAGGSPTTGSAGEIQLAAPATSFTVSVFEAWTSADDGISEASGTVTFRGTPAGGGPALVETVFINPPDIATYDFVTFTGALSGAAITALEIDMTGSGLNYIGIDNLTFTAVLPTTCPTVGAVSASETSVCVNDPFDITATGLADMDDADNLDQDFGIEFKYFGTTPADPYVGGTSLGTVPFGSLTGGGTTAALVGATIPFVDPTGSIYAVLSPAPTDATCRPSAVTAITILSRPSIDVTLPETYCASEGIVTGGPLVAPTSSSTIYSGTGVTDNGDNMSFEFDVASVGVGVHPVTVTLMNANGCTRVEMVNVTVLALPNTTLTAPADLCINAGVQNNLGGGTPPEGTITGDMGVYSGPGVTDDGNGMTYDFDPAIAGVGTHELFYAYTDENGCTGTGSDMVEVFATPNVMFTAPADVCLSDVPITGLGGGTPVGGTYMGAGVIDDGNGMTFTFEPGTAGVGVHNITYTVGIAGCSGSATDDIEVFALPITMMTAPEDRCESDPVSMHNNLGTPLGGVYSGDGVTDGGNGTSFTFDPSAAGAGVHTLFYNFTDANGCTGSGSDLIEVFAAPVPTFNAPADLCLDAGLQSNLFDASPFGGVYSGPGVTDGGNGVTYDFDPAAAGVGVHELFYALTDMNGCTGTGSDFVEVFALPIVDFTAPADACENELPLTGLSGGTPTGGVYSGPGVADDGNGMTYTFNPAIAGTGTHVLQYVFADGNGCSGTGTDMVEVFSPPTTSFTGPADLCLNAGVQNDLGGGTPTGGTYSGPGVSDDGNGMTYDFDPANAGVGVHELIYEFTDANGCTGSGSDMVEVFALPTVNFTAPADLCIDAGVQAGLGGGTPPQGTVTGDLGVYSGSGVTDDGNGMTYSFDPAAAGVGVHDLTYTYTDENGCSVSATDEIEVFDLPVVDFSAPADVCENALPLTGLSGGTPMGGVYSGSGVVDDGNGMTYTFNPATAGVGTHVLQYAFTGSNGCSGTDTDMIEVFAPPTIEFTGPADLCIDAGVQNDLGGATPTGGIYSGPGVTDDGNGMTYDFDPANAGVGIHELIYEFTDANGCIGSGSDMVEVFALPIVNFTAPADLCIDAGVQAGLGGGTPPQGTVTGDLGVYSGSGVTDDGNGMTYSFDPAAAGVGVHDLTYTYTDENGCTNSATDQVEVFALPVVTFTAPVLDVCIEDPVEMGLGGGMPIGGVYTGLGVMDDGNGMTFSFDPTASAPGGGNVPVTYTFTDANGCTSSAIDDIFVDPICCELIVTCPAANDLGAFNCTTLDMIPDCPVDSATAVAAPYNIIIGPEPCGKVEVLCTDDITTYDVCAMGGQTVNRQIIIYDDLNDDQMFDPLTEESDTCTFVFNIEEDVTPPMIVCPANLTIECLDSTDPVDTGMATATDNCMGGGPGPMITFIDLGTPDFCSGYQISRTWTATDACGNMAMCTQMITVEAPENPVVTCPLNLTIQCDESTEPANTGMATATADCNQGVMVSFVDASTQGTTGCSQYQYEIMRTWTATDDCGNMDVCTQVITVIDDVDPVITCPANIIISCAENTDPANTGTATGTDNCSSVNEVIITSSDVSTQGTAGCSQYQYEIIRTWTATDDCGNTDVCTQVITVIDDIDPVITCPTNINISCSENTDPANTGTATGTDNCSSVNEVIITSSDISTQEGEGCGQFNYTIFRTWLATDACDNTSSCIQIIEVADTTPPAIVCSPSQTFTCFETLPPPATNAADFIALGGTISDDCTMDLSEFTVFAQNDDNGGDNCPGNARIVVRTYFVADACGNTSTCEQTFTYLESTTVPVITSVLPTCYKYCASLANPMESDITYTTDCSFEATVSITGPTVIGQENCPGTIYRYTYVVTDDCGRSSAPVTRDFVIGNDGPTIECAPFNLILECGDPDNQDYINAHLEQVSANTSCELGVNISYFPQNFNLISCGAATVVTFTATDDCGRTATCTTTVAIQDNTPPTFTSIPPSICDVTNCSADINYWYNHWIDYMEDGLEAEDACDSNVSIQAINTPVNTDCPDGTAETVVTFVATDNCGNETEITGTFIVEATPSSLNILGLVATEEAETVESVTVTLEGNNGLTELYQTEANGEYGFEDLVLSNNYTVTPYLDEDHLNGVSSYDLVLISRHILELQILDSPYKMIAADINNSGSITTMDMVELRKLILHIDESFENNTSWRFIESAFVFPEPTNPFATIFPEAVYINGLTAEEQHDFVGVKIGDVNGSVTANALAGAEDRTFVDDLVLHVEDRQLEAGETYEVAFRSDNFVGMHGYQFTLDFDQDAVSFVETKAGELPLMSDGNFGLKLLDRGAITTSWSAQRGETLAKESNLFTITFTAIRDAKLSEVLRVGSRYTKAEAYNEVLDLMDVKLRFETNEQLVKEGFKLYQNMPNPFMDETVIGFDLPESSKATLSIYDASGKLLLERGGTFDKGYNNITVSAEALTSGLLYYQLVTPTNLATRKMILER